MGSAAAGAWVVSCAWAKSPPPRLLPSAPTSLERLAVIESFKAKSEGLQKRFEALEHKGEWVMPYRLFRPESSQRLPLVVYLHGSGGQGTDNEKQLALGNIFGTRVWLLPENQERFPCYVVAPQSDRGWVPYDPELMAKGEFKVVPGVGHGVTMALAVVDELRRRYAIDDSRIYVTGQSMGGAGTWNAIASRPDLFAAAAICCGSRSSDDGSGSPQTPVWNFHGESDEVVPVSLSRDRIAARRKAGGQPIASEYTGVGHDVWQWAYTEPELVTWLFAQQRR
jgi:predicted peptidase